MKQKKVWLLAGPPGCGKSTWARQRVTEYGGVHCSRDEIRFSLLKDDEDYFAHEDEVIRLWTEKVHQAILSPAAGDVYIDATHLTERSRAKVIDSLPTTNYTLITVFFDVPLETCIERNDNRKGRAFVPRSVIRRMHACFEKDTQYGDGTLHLNENGEWRDIE